MNRYFQVNWINGMKITADHFIELENHFIYRTQSAFRGYVNPLNYGLIPGIDENLYIPHFSVSSNHDKVTILNGFVAMTPEGHLIQIPANQEFPVTRPNIQSDWYFLVVSSRPYERTPFGEINAHENPSRYPYAMQDYRFEFFAPKNEHFHVLENNKIPIGLYNGSAFEEDKTYIPPCTSIQSHPELINLYKAFQEAFSELERKILMLIKTKDHSTNTMLAGLLGFFSQHKTAIDNYIQYQPPYFLFEKIQQMARIIHYSLKIQDSAKVLGKEVLGEIVDFRYNHFEIKKAVEMANQSIKLFFQFLPGDSRVRPQFVTY
jgi:hypothetical protein